MLKKCLLISLFLLYYQQTYAGGVSLGATRLIYPRDQGQAILKIYNSDNTSNYLVQSWISDDQGRKTNDFVVTPPLFVIKANTDNILKVVYTGNKENLPKNKEKLYFLNAKVIPSLTEEEQSISNALLISTTTKIKLFVRPSSINDNPLEAYKNMGCSYSNNTLKINNPTPFYLNLVSLKIDGKDVSNSETVPPKSSISLKNKLRGKVLTYNFINDYGVQIKDRQCNL